MRFQDRDKRDLFSVGKGPGLDEKKNVANTTPAKKNQIHSENTPRGTATKNNT